MEAVGKVIRTSGLTATVEIVRASACGENCASCAGGCGGAKRTVTARNDVGAAVGDMVRMELSGNRVLFAAFIVYIIPIFLLIIGLAAFGAGVGIAIFAAAFAALVLLDKKLAPRYTAHITKAWRKSH